MQFTVNDTEQPLRKSLTISATIEEVDQRVDELMAKVVPKVNARGFRPGRLAKPVINKRYGPAARKQILDDMLSEGLKNAFSQYQLVPVSPLDITGHDETNGHSITVAFDIRPPFTVPPVHEFSLPVSDTTVHPGEVDAELDHLAKRLGSQAPISSDAAIQENDLITLTGTIAGTDGQKVRDIHDHRHLLGAYPLFGKSTAEAVSLFSGHRIGDVVRFPTRLPEPFDLPAWAGKDAQIEVTIQAADRVTPIVINDALAKNLGTASLDELKDRIHQQISQNRQDMAFQQACDAVLDQLLTRVVFQVPPHHLGVLIAANLNRIIAARKQQEPGLDETAARAAEEPRVRTEVERLLRRSMILDVVAERYEVKTTEQDIQQQILLAARSSGRKPEEIAEQLKDQQQLQAVVQDIRQHKALAVLIDAIRKAQATV